MAINRELSQFGRLVEISDGSHIGIGTTSNVNIGFGTITATTVTATTFYGDGSNLTGVSGFSGSYNDLTNKPTIPTNNNQLTNGAGYITGYTVTQSDVTSHQAALSITESQISDLGSYITASSTDTLTNKTLDAPTFTGNATFDTNTLYVDSANNRIGVGTDAPAYQFEIENTGANALLVLDRTDGAACFIEGQATRSAFGSVNATPLALAYNSLAVVTIGAGGSIRVNPDGDGYTFPTTDGSANQVLQTDGEGNLSFATAGGFSGSYNDLTDQPTIPTNNNQLTNGAGYITGYTVTQSDVTQHQAALSITESQISDLGSYATISYVDAEVAGIVDTAPATLDTLNELAAALGDDANFSTTVTNSIATKLPLAGGQMTGNITFSGAQTVDGRDLSVDGAKLDGIESGATADQTASEILTAIKTVDGSGSGLDADTLDGLDSTQFLRSDANDASTGRIQFQANNTNNWDTIATATGSLGGIEIYNNVAGNDAFMAFHAGGDYAFYFGLDATTNDLSVGGWSMGANKYRVWHAGNDGSGSGLDADLLDGQQGSYYLDYNNFINTPAAGGSPGGSNTQIQYNSSGTFAGSANLTFDGTNLTCGGQVSATDFNSTSDINLKKNIEKIENPLDKLSEISGVTFQWIENDKQSGGVIAQDVEKVMPELVGQIEDHKSVNYNGLIGLLVECVKEQQKQIDELKSRIGA